MRRAVARGRVFPQFFSTDRRYGRLSLKAIGIFPLMWANADDQGRLTGDSEEIKYAVCPNIDHITKQDVPEILEELQSNDLILCYDTPKSAAIQLLDWWDVHQKLQWAWPSDYDAPQGWQDRLRYKRGTKEVVTQNWYSQVGNQVGNQVIGYSFSGDNPGGHTGEKPGENSGDYSGGGDDFSPLTTPLSENEKEKEKEYGRGKRNSPEDSAEEPRSLSDSGEENPSPSTVILPVKLLKILSECYYTGWGTFSVEEPGKIIPRPLDGRIDAQLRDLSNELSRVGGCPLEYIEQAFREAATHNKYHVSYVRTILLEWLGVESSR